MQLVARDVFEDIAPFVGLSGTCPEDEEKIISYLNKLSQDLWVRGDWKGTIEYGCINPSDCCFGLPSHLEEVRNAWYCNQTMLVRDEYYQGMSHVGIESCCGSCCMPQIIQTGEYHPYQKTIRKGWRLAVQGSAIEEEELTFYFLDYAGQRREEKVTPNLDLQKLNITPGQFLNVEKPRTKGFVRLVSWHPDYQNYFFVARYEAHEENPVFSHYKVTGVPTGQDCPQIIVRAKKKYVPIRSATDVLWLNSRAAIEFGAMALNAKLARDNAGYVDNLRLAEEQLEEILENQKPQAWSPLDIKYEKQAMSPQATGRLRYGHPRRYGLL